jgi:formylglycine-generating enzyme required for sulfatase activity
VFWEVYNYCTNDDTPDTGLLADGLKCEQARRMAWRDRSEPPDSFRPHQVQRARDLLGAIAFELLAKTDAEGLPAPWWNGVASNLPAFQAAAKDRFLRAGALVTSRGVEEYEGFFDQDWGCLLRMDSHGLKHFLFSTDAREDQLRWTDATTMSFFAAYWACRWATPEEREQTRRWVVNPLVGTNEAFREFWTLAADMPGEAIDCERRIALFTPLYGRELLDEEGFPIRSTEFIYRSWKFMEGTPARQGFLAELPALVAAGNAVAAEVSPAGDNPNFRPIPAGTFWMGAQDAEDEADDDERPRHQVTFSAFRMNCFVVTNAQYELFDPDHRRDRGRFDTDMGQEFDDDRRPVVNVTWYDAWCLARWTGNHLPTEAQWECACRGGALSHQAFHFGDSLSSNQANFNGPDPYYVEPHDYLARTTKVGSYPANGFGLYDMHGNVWEWCADWYAADFYQTEKALLPDPVNEEVATTRVLRGGSWFGFGRHCRSAVRGWREPDSRNPAVGFRLAAVPDVGAKSGEPESEA